MAGLRFFDATNFGISAKAARNQMKENKQPVYQYLIDKANEKRANGTPTKTSAKAAALLNIMNRLRTIQEIGADPKILAEYLKEFWDLFLKPKLQNTAKRSANAEAKTTFENNLFNVNEIINQFINHYEEYGDIQKAIHEITLMTTSAPEIQSEKLKKVQLMTIHASKGLEFDTVYLIGTDNDSFLSKDISEIPQSFVEESRRLFYVGITRAKNTLLMSRAQKRLIHGEYVNTDELEFIKEIKRHSNKTNIKLINQKTIKSYEISPEDTYSAFAR
jgi:superfamily I DNA/RNA helicase